MTDFADVATDIADQHLAVSLANHQIKQSSVWSEYCEECGEVIPPARLAVIATTRCVDCQGIFEAKSRVSREV